MTEMELYRIINEMQEKLDTLIKQQEILVKVLDNLHEILKEGIKNKAPN
jgi:hypothetical protein